MTHQESAPAHRGTVEATTGAAFDSVEPTAMLSEQTVLDTSAAARGAAPRPRIWVDWTTAFHSDA